MNHRSSLKQRDDMNDRKKQLALDLSVADTRGESEEKHINISNVVRTFENNSGFVQHNNNNTTSSASFYYDIATPKSPHDESLLMYEMDAHSMANPGDGVVIDHEKAMEKEKLSKALLEEQDRLEQELREKEEKQVTFQVSKKEILNNIHLFMTMKYKENQSFKKKLETVREDIHLLERLHQKKSLRLLNSNDSTPITAGAPQSVSPLNQQQHASLNQHHRRNYTNTCPTRNSGIVGKTSEGIPVFKRFDGIMIIIKCVACGREGFTSPQGIVNHARLKHSKFYSSQQLAILDNQQLLETQSTKVLAKFKELDKDPIKDFLPLVAISLSPISTTDSVDELDRKLMLVEEKSSHTAQQKNTTFNSVQTQNNEKGRNDTPIENNKLALQQPKPVVALRHLSNFQKNGNLVSGKSIEQDGNYDLINETVHFLKNFKPKSAIPSRQANEGHFESSVSSFPSVSATPNNNKTVPRSTVAYTGEPETKKRKPTRGKNDFFDYVRDNVTAQSSVQDLDQKPTLGSTFYNLRSRKRSSIPSKKWDDFVLYQ
ncbi:hypothetical protein ACO0QE_000604 [Hanseniaspora vineae]